MKGVVFLGDRTCSVVEVQRSEPGYGEVLVRIAAAGICGSDLHVYRSESATDQVRGHEPSGIVEAVGSGIRRLKRGDRVIVYQHQGCGVCYECGAGEPVACRNGKRVVGVDLPGAFGEYMVVPERFCVPLPPNVGFADGAVIACTGSTAYGALRRLGVSAFESVAVFGLGPVGLSAVLIGRAMGLRVIGVDVVPERVNLALQCGAEEAIDASRDNPVPVIREFGRVSGGERTDGVDYVVEASGSRAARESIVPVLRRGGKAAVVGVGGLDGVVSLGDVLNRALTILGSVVFPVAWMWDLARLCAVGGLSFEPLVAHHYQLDEAVKALQVADEGRAGKVLFTNPV